MKKFLEAKNRRFLAVLGVIALAAVIGFSFVSCIINLPEDGPDPGPGNYDYRGDNIAEFRSWLAGKSENTANNPYNVRLNISSLGGNYNNQNSLGWVLRQTNTAGRYVSLDLSGSTFTAIPESALRGNSILISVTIPSRVNGIGNHAFRDCASLTGITIPNGVTSVGSYAFAGCNSLTGITIPNSVTSVGSYAFQNCSSMLSVSTGSGIAAISDHAFMGCSSMTSLSIGYNVINIDNYAFQDCTSLQSVIIPSSVQGFGTGSFMNCSSLTSVTFQGTIPSTGWYSSSYNPSFTGDLRTKFYATNKEYGTPGTYTRAGTSWTWIGY